MRQQRHLEIIPFAQGCTVSGSAEVERLKPSVFYSGHIYAVKAQYVICKISRCFLQKFSFLGEEVGESEEQRVWRIKQSKQGLLIPGL